MFIQSARCCFIWSPGSVRLQATRIVQRLSMRRCMRRRRGRPYPSRRMRFPVGAPLGAKMVLQAQWGSRPGPLLQVRAPTILRHPPTPHMYAVTSMSSSPNLSANRLPSATPPPAHSLLTLTRGSRKRRSRFVLKTAAIAASFGSSAIGNWRRLRAPQRRPWWPDWV